MSKLITCPKLIPIEMLPVLAFPSNVLPGFLGDQVEAVAEYTETPIELAALNGLSAIAASTQGKYEIEIKAGYREPTNLYTATVLPSGNRKTAVLNEMAAPLQEWESEKAGQILRDTANTEVRRNTIQSRLHALRSRVGKANSEDFVNIEKEIQDLQASMPKVPLTPRVWTQDVTPEKLAELMVENNERMAIFSDEGGLFDIMAGRYSRGIPNLDIFLQAHSGSSVRVDRVSRPPLSIKRAVLTIALSPQGQVFESLSENPQFRGRGLLARFLYAFPLSLLGFRTFTGPPIPPDVKTRYGDGIRALLNKKGGTTSDGIGSPYIIRFSSEAYEEWLEFALLVETEMRPGNILSHITDWAGKLPGAAARIAGLLHCVEHAHDQPSRWVVPPSTIRQALAIAAVLRSHALAIFDLMGADPNIHAARKILEWIHTKHYKNFTARQCFQDLKGHFNRMSNLRPGFAVLQERHYIFRSDRTAEEKGPGRPSEGFVVNPIVREGWS